VIESKNGFMAALGLSGRTLLRAKLIVSLSTGDAAMSRRMPPLNPLHVFDVAARSISFTDAANQLSVTQAAVSRQISTLEDYLGVKLFARDARALTLTAEGRRLHREISPAFDAIGLATSEILRKRDPNVVTIQTYPTVIAQKLLPHLGKLLESDKRLELHFSSAVRPDEFSLEHADIVIRLGPEMTPNLRGFEFAQDVILPAVSPMLLDRSQSAFSDLVADYPLIESKFRHSDWLDWAQASKVDIDGARRLHFESSLLAYQAARDGVGICIAQAFLIEDDVAHNALVALTDQRLRRDSFYWCLVSPRRRHNRQLTITLDWLESLKATGDGLGPERIRAC
jgi:LysR family transcriptional regulator, glycine cleavage system transcriptional activator